MKFKYALYGILVLSLGFTVIMGYLFYSNRSSSSVFDSERSDDAGAKSRRIEVPDDSKTVSGAGGSLIIAYAGDIAGNMFPCG